MLRRILRRACVGFCVALFGLVRGVGRAGCAGPVGVGDLQVVARRDQLAVADPGADGVQREARGEFGLARSGHHLYDRAVVAPCREKTARDGHLADVDTILLCGSLSPLHTAITR